MRVGTKSVLFGFHQFIIHPIFVGVAWNKLYGLPLDPRLWLSFFVHDLGYVGKKMMDDEIGESHPELGAKIMSLFGKEWSDFVLLHSRYYSKRLGKKHSKLCVADKLSITLYPYWLWKFLVCATGEIDEYLEAQKYIDHQQKKYDRSELDKKHKDMVAYLLKWVEDNK